MFNKFESKLIPKSELGNYTGVYPISTGKIEANPNYECKSRILEDYYMILVTDGEGEFRTNGRDYKLKKGDLYFLFPNVIHSYKTHPKRLMTQLWIGLNGANVNVLLEEGNINEKNPIVRTNGDSNILSFFSKIHAQLEYPSNGSIILCTGYIYCIIGELIKLNGKDEILTFTSNKKVSNPIGRSVAYIENHFTDQISMDMVARHCGLSRSHFSTKFTAEVGISPSKYLTKIRLKQSLHYIENTNISIQEIAHSAGFDNGLYFSKVFTKHFHQSPTAYRKSSNLKKRKENPELDSLNSTYKKTSKSSL